MAGGGLRSAGWGEELRHLVAITDPVASTQKAIGVWGSGETALHSMARGNLLLVAVGWNSGKGIGEERNNEVGRGPYQ